MPILTNPRHEKFAQLLAQGQSAHQSYIDAGFKASRANASRLKANDSIMARVFELQGAGAKSAEVSVASLLDELEAARAKATTLGQLSAAVRATSEKAKISGLLIERQQIEISSPDPYEDCQSPEDIGAVMADQMLGELTNARWLPITDADRVHLAGILNRALAEAQAFVHSVNRGPLLKEGTVLLTERDVKPKREI